MTEKKKIASIVRDSGQIPERRSLRLEAADKLRDLILLEELPPGTAVPERDVSEALGISRTPLKDALRILEAEGLIKYGPTGRPRVANPSLHEVEQNFTVLGSLEALAGDLACRTASDEEIEELIAMEKAMRKLPAKAYGQLNFFRADMAFHSRIVEVAYNLPLKETHRHYNARLFRTRFMSARRKVRRQNTLDEHRAIVESLAKRDRRATSRALRRHLSSTVKNIRSIWPEEAT